MFGKGITIAFALASPKAPTVGAAKYHRDAESAITIGIEY